MSRVFLRGDADRQQIVYLLLLIRLCEILVYACRHHLAYVRQTRQQRRRHLAYHSETAEILRQSLGGALAHMAYAQGVDKACQQRCFARFQTC